MQLDIPSLKISLQNNKFHCPIAGRHSESQLFQKKLKNLGFFMKEQVKNHPFSGWLFIFPIFQNHGYTAELNLSFENCNLSISRITLITARGSVPVSNNPLTLEIISNLCSKWQTLVGAQHNVCGHVLSPSCTHFYHYWQP